jgi:hypothetical protein
MFPVYGGKCLLRKGVHNWFKKLSQCFADYEEVETGMRKWLRQQSKDFYAAGFEALGHVHQCWWRICREINVFPGSNITCFTFYTHL